MKIKVKNPAHFPLKQDNSHYSIGDILDLKMAEAQFIFESQGLHWTLGADAFEFVQDAPAVESSETAGRSIRKTKSDSYRSPKSQ